MRIATTVLIALAISKVGASGSSTPLPKAQLPAVHHNSHARVIDAGTQAKLDEFLQKCVEKCPGGMMVCDVHTGEKFASPCHAWCNRRVQYRPCSTLDDTTTKQSVTTSKDESTAAADETTEMIPEQENVIENEKVDVATSSSSSSTLGVIVGTIVAIIILSISALVIVRRKSISGAKDIVSGIPHSNAVGVSGTNHTAQGPRRAWQDGIATDSHDDAAAHQYAFDDTVIKFLENVADDVDVGAPLTIEQRDQAESFETDHPHLLQDGDNGYIQIKKD